MGISTLAFFLSALALTESNRLIYERDKSQLYSYCTSLISTCPPAFDVCATSLCLSCQLVGGYTFSSCCKQAAPTACFQSAFGSSLTDSNLIACSSAYDIIFSCSGETSQFTSLDTSSQASCLCYSSGTWVPDVFDGLWGHCYDYHSTDSRSTIGSKGAMCASVGNILSATASASITGEASSMVPSISASPSPTTAIAVATSFLPTSTPTHSSEASMVNYQALSLYVGIFAVWLVLG